MVAAAVVRFMAPGSRRPTALGTERCHRCCMTPVMRQRTVRKAVVSPGLRCVADQCGAVDRDNEILAPDRDDCATGCDGQGRGDIGVFDAVSIMSTAPISMLAERPRMVSVRLSVFSFQELWNCARAGVFHVTTSSDSVDVSP